MIGRRDLIVGTACLAGAGAAYALQPRRHVSLLERGRTVEEIVPRAFTSWKSQDVTDLVAPKIEDSLASRLYGETVGRVYRNGDTGEEIMMLLAHGDTQSEDLQLHRPEICYPAFGFSISHSAVTEVGLAPRVTLPSRRLVAEAPDRRETIVYWSRLGEYLPLDRRQQQLDRLKTAMKGDIADGMLARFSMLGADSAAAVGVLERFIPVLVRAVAADNRDVLIGSQRAAALATTGI
jgi:EpsI family protein